jgi:hypothetical protein
LLSPQWLDFWQMLSPCIYLGCIFGVKLFNPKIGDEKIFASREGAAEGGCGGNSAMPERSA